MFNFIMIFAMSYFGSADLEGDYDIILVECRKEFKDKYGAKSEDLCQCHQKRIREKLDPVSARILAKIYLGQSVQKEMDTVEGATVIEHFDDDIIDQCKKQLPKPPRLPPKGAKMSDRKISPPVKAN